MTRTSPAATDRHQAPAHQPSVRFESVTFRYGRVAAIQDASFALLPGEVAYLVGPSGSGKTTLLRLAHGELRPSAGRLQVAGMALHRAGRAQVRRLRRAVGVVYQDYKLLARLTAVENVAYALRVADLALSAREARERAAGALERVGLGGRLDAFPRQLSGGQQQRVSIARAVAARPTVLLADEPTANLDAENAGLVSDLLDGLADQGTTVLVATCDTDLAMAARRVVRLAAGAIVEDRAPQAGAPSLRVVR